MNRLKSKASQFFKNSPSQDEKIANVSAYYEADFDAGIEGGLREKSFHFLRCGSEEPWPAFSSNVTVSNRVPPPIAKDGVHEPAEAAVYHALNSSPAEIDKSLPELSVSPKMSNPKAPTIVNENARGSARKHKPTELALKKRPSFASLRKSSSRIFRTNAGNHDPPPPPLPQIPVDTPTLKPRRPTLRPFDLKRFACSSRSSSGRVVSISRPVSSTQVAQLPATFNSSKIPFTKPFAPAPPRPARPQSLDDELIALMRDGSARMILHTPNRARTMTVSISSSARSRALTRVGSDEAYARLGLPFGNSSLSSPRSPVFDSPLAAKFPHDPSRPLPFRDSSDSVTGYGRLSAYINAREHYSSGAYEDGVCRNDREFGPIEQYGESECGDWTLEQRITGKLGDRGMLFRDRWGGWHLVPDV